MGFSPSATPSSARSASTTSRGGSRELGAGDRARDPHPPEDSDEDVLPLRGCLPRAGERADLSRVPGAPGLAAGAEREGDRMDDQARAGAPLWDRRERRLPPEELLLPGQPEGLPDPPVRRAALPERPAC